MRFHFRTSIRPILKNHIFSIVLEAFHPLYETKISNRSLSVVYGSLTLKFFRGLWELVRTSGSTYETEFKKRMDGYRENLLPVTMLSTSPKIDSIADIQTMVPSPTSSQPPTSSRWASKSLIRRTRSAAPVDLDDAWKIQNIMLTLRISNVFPTIN